MIPMTTSCNTAIDSTVNSGIRQKRYKRPLGPTPASMMVPTTTWDPWRLGHTTECGTRGQKNSNHRQQHKNGGVGIEYGGGISSNPFAAIDFRSGKKEVAGQKNVDRSIPRETPCGASLGGFPVPAAAWAQEHVEADAELVPDVKAELVGELLVLVVRPHPQGPGGCT